MARGHRLNTSIVLAAVHGLSGLYRAVSAVEPITLALFPTLSPSLIGHPASVDVKQHKSQKKKKSRFFTYSVERKAGRKPLASGIKLSTFAPRAIRSEDRVRRGVWLRRYICQKVTQVS